MPVSVDIAVCLNNSVSPIPFQGCTEISFRRGYSVRQITVRGGDGLHCGHLQM